LVLDGPAVTATVAGAVSMSGAAFIADNGAAVTLSGLTSLVANGSPTTLFANSGSSIALPALASVIGNAGTNFVSFLAYGNSTVTLPALTSLTSGFPVLRAEGVGSQALAGPLVANGSLVNGRYQVRVIAGQVTNTTGLNLDGNVDGLTGDDYTNASSGGSGVFRLYGDANGNAIVDSADFLAFRLAFLSSDPVFDFDGSGQVNSTDFLAFRLAFLQTV
jgi:hypothetical protein